MPNVNASLACKVDDEDYEMVKDTSWYTVKGYVRGRFDGGQPLLHRLIMDFPEEMQVDHIDGDKLNNQKSNLRVCTNGQNQMNGGAYRNSSSKFRGVSWEKAQGKWRADIQANKKTKHLGVFESERDAAKAYNEAAKELHGEFARLNKI